MGALVKAQQSTAVAMTEKALGWLAQLMSGTLAPPELSFMLVKLRTWLDALDELSTNARDQLLGLVKKEGKSISTKGTLRAQFGEYEIEARPRNTGVNPGRLEGLLRAKSIDPATVMAQCISYNVDADMLQAAVAKGVLTAAEVEACRFVPTYNVHVKRNVVE